MDTLYFDTFPPFTDDPWNSSGSEDGASNSCGNVPCKRCKDAAHLCKRCRRKPSAQRKSALELACKTNHQPSSETAGPQVGLTTTETLPRQSSSTELTRGKCRSTVSAENNPKRSLSEGSSTSDQVLLLMVRRQCCQWWRCRRRDSARNSKRCPFSGYEHSPVSSNRYWNEDIVTKHPLPDLPRPRYAQDILRR